MLDSDRPPETEAPEELLADMPLPSDAKTFFLGGMFFLAILTTAYIARDIVLPLIFALMLNLLMQPALRMLERSRVPKGAGSDFAHSYRVRDDCRTWRRHLRTRRSVDSQAARRRSPPSGAVELSQRPYRHASDLSGGGQQFRRRGPAAKLGRAFGRRSNSLERLCRDAKLRQRPVHHCPVSLLPACFGGQLPAAVRRAAARVQKQAAGGRHLAANRTRYFRLSPHNYPHERPCRRRDRPRHVVDRSRRSFWLWGVPGAILSAPILATTKIVCDRVRPLAALGHTLAG